MRYLLMIYRNEPEDADRSEAEKKAEAGAYWTFDAEVTRSGVKAGGAALHVSATATTVRLRGDKAFTDDGPFAPGIEQVGGFYLLECRNLDEAIRWAAKIPHAARCAVEIRPVFELPTSVSANAK